MIGAIIAILFWAVAGIVGLVVLFIVTSFLEPTRPSEEKILLLKILDQMKKEDEMKKPDEMKKEDDNKVI